MCGIIGVTGEGQVVPRLLDSLKRLEYRGYDSAGVAAVVDGQVERRRAKGKIRALEEVLADEPLKATVGIGHTRWATHGAPNVPNAHPHQAGRVTLVHNGIIENFAELKAELTAQGHVFESQTDTEVVAHLLDQTLSKGAAPLDAFKATLDRLTGAYALAVLIEGEDGLILGARRGSPLVVGWGEGEMFLGSDALAVGPFTQTISYLEEGDYVAVDRSGARLARLRENLARLRLAADVVEADAATYKAEPFDAVLLDAPCTATGTFRRNPEVLRATKPAEVAKLADVQHRLLDAAAERVKPGGRVVYCVCSLEREEGETQIIAFLRRNPAFRTVPADPAALGCPPEALTPEGWLRILPSMWAEHGGLDGFFAARLERVS